MTRNSAADPDMPQKLAENRMEDMHRATACGTCLDQSKSIDTPGRINAAMGTEKYL